VTLLAIQTLLNASSTTRRPERNSCCLRRGPGCPTNRSLVWRRPAYSPTNPILSPPAALRTVPAAIVRGFHRLPNPRPRTPVPIPPASARRTGVFAGSGDASERPRRPPGQRTKPLDQGLRTVNG